MKDEQSLIENNFAEARKVLEQFIADPKNTDAIEKRVGYFRLQYKKGIR